MYAYTIFLAHNPLSVKLSVQVKSIINKERRKKKKKNQIHFNEQNIHQIHQSNSIKLV